MYCDKCDIYFSKKYSLNRHLEKGICKDKIVSTPIIETEIIKCQYCSKLFDKRFRLERHLTSSKGECYKKRNTTNQDKYKKSVFSNNVINNNQTYNQTYIQNQTYIHNTNHIQNQTINIQPIIKNVILAKHGEETISHITKDVMLEILDIESFPKMCTELMRLLYFNKEVPENRNWTIVYPRNKNAGIEYNHISGKFERKTTYNIIDDKFSNMVNLLFELVQEISNEDLLNNNLSKRQKININKYGMHFGQLDISKTSKEVYNSIHSLAYDSRIEQMKEWGENGHQGNHLSLKFK